MMKRVIEFLNKTQFGTLATIDDGIPKVRPIQFQFEENGKIYFCTSADKNMAGQLKKCPRIAYCTFDKTFHYVCLSGEIKRTESLKIKSHIFHLNPFFKEHFETPENKNMLVFYLEHGIAKIGDYSNYPPEIIKF